MLQKNLPHDLSTSQQCVPRGVLDSSGQAFFPLLQERGSQAFHVNLLRSAILYHGVHTLREIQQTGSDHKDTATGQPTIQGTHIWDRFLNEFLPLVVALLLELTQALLQFLANPLQVPFPSSLNLYGCFGCFFAHVRETLERRAGAAQRMSHMHICKCPHTHMYIFMSALYTQTHISNKHGCIKEQTPTHERESTT